jgi:L-threonylcarbamoyladenylate synthase
MNEQASRLHTLVRPADADGITQAVQLLEHGQPVALPTETVYGLAADATDGAAVARIYAAKGRPSFNPLIVHVLDTAAAGAIAALSPAATALAAAFWPGPLTLVLPKRPGSVAELATAGLPSVAVRAPAHPVFRAVLEQLGKPLAAPSANASGQLSPTRASHVADSLQARVALVLDGGPTEHGLESTIVAVLPDRLDLLRPGPLLPDQLAAVSGLPCAPPAAKAVQSPGQLASHYAPHQMVRLNAREKRPGEVLIGFGEVAGDITLSASGDLVEAASRLFDVLHQAQARDAHTIAVAPIPAEGLGLAIQDRLRRAAADRAEAANEAAYG